ncbi:hypothetical protein [Streptomyces sp. CAU 1734]|uniref:hypothetical protein n=1 Tax=Streptomyces sp. CAU 1734 TaxID=3140360 RepID=UPI00326041DB
MKLFRTAAAVGVAAALAFPLVPASATADGRATPATGAALSATAEEATRTASRNAAGKSLMRRQAPILEAADEISGLAKRDRRSGYSGLNISVEKNGYALRWKGQPPKDVTRAIATHRKRGLSVEVTSARYSAKELRRAMDAIAGSGIRRVNGAKIVRVSPGKDGNSLTVGVNTSGAALRTFADKPNTAGALPASLTRGIPVSLTSATEATPASNPAFDRRLGESTGYHYGGQVIMPTYGGRCTAGFGAYDRQKGTDYLITAEHCTTQPGQIWRNGRDSSLGTLETADASNDTAYIRVEGNKRAGGYIVGGSPAGERGQPMLTVGTWRDTYHGQYVCFSGALTGERCGVPVSGSYGWQYVQNKRYWTIDTGESPWEYVAGKGDSGGPVYSYLVSGGVVAHGLISSTSRGFFCWDPIDKQLRGACSKYVSFTSLTEALETTRISLR